MADLLELMAAPFAACVVLVGIHAYLGLHVIQRKVIFVDLALAQIAALGATFGFLLGVSPHGRTAYLFSLAFAVIGAAIFALTRMRHERIPQEAIIGIVYAVALASAILVADRAPEGSEHIKETLTGALLWVRWPTIFKTAAIYALVGLLHVGLRRRFFQISFEPEQAYAEGRWVRLWDFIFYVTFAFVITSSVAIAGVLVVFSFLVIPAVIATLFAERVGHRLALGWSVGIVACMVGLMASYRLDLPSGPSVVAALGGALILAALLYSVWKSEQEGAGSAQDLGGARNGGHDCRRAGRSVHQRSVPPGGARSRVGGETRSGDARKSGVGAGPLALLQAACGADAVCVAERLSATPDWPAAVSRRLREDGGAEREIWIEALGAMDSPTARDLLAESASHETDPLLRLRVAELLIASGDARGLTVAAELLDEATPLLVREEARALIASQAADGQEVRSPI